MSYGGRSLVGHVQAADDRDGSIVQGASTVVVMMTVVSAGPVGGVIDGAPPDPAWDWQRPPILEYPATGRLQYLQGIHFKIRRVSSVLSKGLGSRNCNNLKIHFLHQHVWYKIVVLEKSNRPHPLCPLCDIFVP